MEQPTTIELAQLHPLFRRLTGQVAWTLFEEHEVDAETIGRFMDRSMAWLEYCLGILRPVLTQAPDMPPYIQILVDGKAWSAEDTTPCPTCSALHGAVIDTSHARAVSFLPPYALGCRARPKALSLEDFHALAEPWLLDLDAEPPAQKFTCDRDWLFSHPW
ncbi:MAG: hypothetical protein D6E12_07630 [Desulfovibrio sp.]|nr:MAG: hypothetical protein D6E12_07630 [Desulfovibrio sp.]